MVATLEVGTTLSTPQPPTRRFGIAASLVGIALLAVACDPAADDADAGLDGDVESWQIWIDPGPNAGSSIPSSQFVDGWSVTLEHAYVRVSNVIGDEDVFSIDEGKVFDLAVAPATGEAGFLFSDESVPVGHYHGLSFTIAPGDAVAGNVSASEAQALVDSGLSYRIEGSATKDGTTYTFQWDLNTERVYAGCYIHAELEAGPASNAITIRPELLFADTVSGMNGELRFDAIAAADVDGDLVITGDELWGVDFASLVDYDAEGLEIGSLWDYVLLRSTQLGFADGDIECE